MGDCKQQSTIRANAANVDALGNTGAQGNGEVTIDVKPFNGIRSGGSQAQTGWGVHQLKYLLTGSIVHRTTLGISTAKVVIDALFAVPSNGLPIGDERHVKEHVSAKGQSSWRRT